MIKKPSLWISCIALLLYFHTALANEITAIPGIYKTETAEGALYANSAQTHFIAANLVDLGGQVSRLGEALSVEEVRLNIGTKLNGVEPDNIVATPIIPIYELTYGKQVMYMDGTGRFLFQDGLLVNANGDSLTANALDNAFAMTAEKNLQAIANISDKEMLQFPAIDPVHILTVFTDTDCPFCRQLHDEIEIYQQNGVSVRYIFFPRQGVNSDSYRIAINVWCSDDPHNNLALAEAGQPVPNAVCSHPVDKHWAAANKLKLTGTPAIMLPDGTLLNGYYPSEKILEELAEF